MVVPASSATPEESAKQASPWLARSYLPDEQRRLGEVRVISEPQGIRVRTLIYSNLLKRVVAEIEAKSEDGWPDGSLHRDESRRYVDLLRAARDEVWSRWRDLGNRERLESTQTLLIDFVVTETRAVIDVGIPDLVDEEGEKRVLKVEPFRDEHFSRAFVRAETLRILEDQFRAEAKTLASRIPAAAAD